MHFRCRAGELRSDGPSVHSSRQEAPFRVRPAATRCNRRAIEGGSMSADTSHIPVPAEWAENAWVDAARYQEMYDRSIADPEGFWGEQGRRIH
ncbi:MAG: acetyl-coenzyme A synthetase N-terminal domain-containing protein, partial [Azospirillaceae bacterium]